jgi:hypothetical protein
MKRYHNSKEENKRKRRAKEHNSCSMGNPHREIEEGRCHSMSPFDCGQPKCKICSKQRIDGKRDRIESKSVVERDLKEWTI